MCLHRSYNQPGQPFYWGAASLQATEKHSQANGRFMARTTTPSLSHHELALQVLLLTVAAASHVAAQVAGRQEQHRTASLRCMHSRKLQYQHTHVTDNFPVSG